MPNDQNIQPFLDKLPIPMEAKAQLWDHYYGATDSNDFKSRLDKLKLSTDTAADQKLKADIWDYKYPAPGIDPDIHATPVTELLRPGRNASPPSRNRLADLPTTVGPTPQVTAVPGLFGKEFPILKVDGKDYTPPPVETTDERTRRFEKSQAEAQASAPQRLRTDLESPVSTGMMPDLAGEQRQADIQRQVDTPVFDVRMSPEERKKHYVIAAVKDSIAGLLTPKNIGLAIGTSVAPPEIGPLISGLFTEQMLQGVYESKPEIMKAVEQGRVEDAKRMMIEDAIQLGFATLSGSHAVKGIGELARGTPVAPVNPARAEILSRLPDNMRANDTAGAGLGRLDQNVQVQERAGAIGPEARRAALMAPRSEVPGFTAANAETNIAATANENASQGLSRLDQRAAPELATPTAIQDLRRNGPSPLVEKSVGVGVEQRRQAALPQPSAPPIQPEALSDVLANKKYTILTAEDPDFKTQRPELNAAAEQNLLAELKARGFQAIPLEGNGEGRVAKGFLVPEMDTQTALDIQETLQRKYGQTPQKEVVTNQGLVDVATKKVRPVENVKYGREALASPFYSTIDMDAQTQLPFAVNFSEKSVPLKEPFQGRHFSDTSGLDVLSGARRGLSGLGAEAERLQLGRGAPGGVYAYAEGAAPEAQYIGRKGEYVVEGEKSLADLSIGRKSNTFADPQWEKVRQDAIRTATEGGRPIEIARQEALNEVEHAVKDAGYDGYRGVNGATFLFGDVPVRGLSDAPGSAGLKETVKPDVLPKLFTPEPEPKIFRGNVPLERVNQEARRAPVVKKTTPPPEEPPFSPAAPKKPSPKPTTPAVAKGKKVTPKGESPHSLKVGFNPLTATKAVLKLFSATPQKGVPDATMDTILEEQATGKSTRKPLTADSFWLRQKEHYYDWLARVHETVKAAEKRGLVLSPSQNPEVISSLALGGGAGGGELAGLDFASIAGRAHKDGVLDMVNAYLNYRAYDRAINIVREKGVQARAAGDHALADEYLDKLNKDKVVPKGYDQTKVRQSIDDLKTAAGADWAKVEGYAKEVWKANGSLWEKLHDAGIISDEAFKDGIRRGPEYVPLERILPDTITALEKAYGASGEVKFGAPVGLSLTEQHVLKSLEGSTLSNVNPFEASLAWHSIGWKDIWRNRAARTFIEFAAKDAGGLANHVFELKGGKGVPDTRLYGTLAYFEDGQVRRYAVPRLIADAMKNLTKKQIEFAGLGGLKFFRDMLRLGATGANLSFSARNAIKDLTDLSVLSKAGPQGMTDGARMLLSWGQTLGQRMAEEFNHFETLRKDPTFREFMEGGASFSTMQKAIRPESFIEKRVPGFTREPVIKQAYRALRTPLTSVERINNAIEETTKLMSYRRLREQGMGPEAAAMETRRFGGSPDFARMGTLSPAYNLMFMFFNASVQGVGRTLAGVARNPKRIGIMLAGLGAAEVALQAWNNQFTNPTSNKPEWDHIISSDKQNYFNIIMPWLEQTPDGNFRHFYFRIPKGHAIQVWNLVQDGVEMGLAAATGKKSSVSPTQSILSTMGALIPGSFQLEEGKVPTSLARGIAASLNPMIKEPMEQLANWDSYRNVRIVPRSMEDLEEWAQVNPNTSPVAEKIAALNRHLPIVKDYPWFTSPVRVEHELRGTFAGLSDFLLTLQKSPAAKMRESTEKTREIPVLGPVLSSFAGSSADQELRTNEEKFYDMYTVASRKYRTFLAMKSDPKKEAEYLTDPENMVWSAAAPMFQSSVEALSQIRQFTRATMASDKLTDEKKQEVLQKLFTARRKILGNVDQMQAALDKATNKVKARQDAKRKKEGGVPEIAPSSPSPSQTPEFAIPNLGPA